MSRHEGVSCDACMKGNFQGRRYKCLICYDYDLCATCYEAGASTTRHTTDHPMQCILTRTDFDVYYGGEAVSIDQPQAFTCPFCSKMGYTEASLHDHVTAEHHDSSVEVVCPVCAALPGGDPNHVTDDFLAHLTLEHRTPRDFDEPIGGMRHVRRIPHPGRGVTATRTRRANMHFQSAAGSALSGLSPAGRETMDPIAELLSQLSSVRNRAAAAQSVSTQLQQLEMQLQSTRSVNGQQLERLPRRQGDSQPKPNSGGFQSSVMSEYSGAVVSTSVASSAGGSGANSVSTGSSSQSQSLLARCGQVEHTEVEQQRLETQRADRSVFVQELLLSSLAEGLRLSSDSSSESGGSDNELYPNAMGAPPAAGGAPRPERNSPNNPSHNKVKQRDVTSMPPDKSPTPHVKQS